LDSGKGKESQAFYTAKVQTAEFYFARLLPRADAHRVGALASTASLMQMNKDHFNMA
jgi:Acetyl-CoA dehydrogenase C-terminal like